jgi:hypothetical protein
MGTVRQKYMLGHTRDNPRPSIWVPGYGLVKPNAKLYPIIRSIYFWLAGTEKKIRANRKSDSDLIRILNILGISAPEGIDESDFVDLLTQKKQGGIIDHRDDPDSITCALRDFHVALPDTSTFPSDAFGFCSACQHVISSVIFFEAGSDSLVFIHAPPTSIDSIRKIIQSSKELKTI